VKVLVFPSPCIGKVEVVRTHAYHAPNYFFQEVTKNKLGFVPSTIKEPQGSSSINLVGELAHTFTHKHKFMLVVKQKQIRGHKFVISDALGVKLSIRRFMIACRFISIFPLNQLHCL
jgi:hypothetical protein